MASQATLPILITRHHVGPWARLAFVGAGVLLLTILAQIYIPLPWTQVPITGQTFGVAFLALTAGRKYAVSMVAAYLGLGWLGLPIFAQAMHGFVLGPTLGYLIGMVFAAALVGWLADLGWTREFGSALLAAYMGTAVIFSCGLFVLSYFVPSEALLGAGLYPFLIGDLLKNLMAALLATGCRSLVERPPTTPNQIQR